MRRAPMLIGAAKRVLALVAALVAAPALAHEIQQGQTLRACDDVNEWPPYAYRQRVDGQATGELTGYTVELMRRIAARNGLRIEFSLLPWRRCLDAVRSGEMQLLLNGIRTPQREREYWISEPIYETRLLYLWSEPRHPQGPPLSGADLSRLRIGGLHGYSYSQLDEATQERLLRAPNYASLLQMLHLGRVDIALVNEAVMLGHAALGHAELGDPKRLGHAPLPDRPPSRFHLMATRIGLQGHALIELINRELPRLERSGELARLRAQFLGELGDSAPRPARR